MLFMPKDQGQLQYCPSEYITLSNTFNAIRLALFSEVLKKLFSFNKIDLFQISGSLKLVTVTSSENL
jgi:hypothetical protein